MRAGRLATRSFLAAFSWVAASSVAATHPPEITVQHIHADVQVLVDKFNRENPDARVKFRQVSFQSLVESLPVQLASGYGPDVSMIPDWGGLARYYLDLRPYVDAAYFEREFGVVLGPMRGEDRKSKAINGMTGSITLNGAFVNVTLFRQAGVALPAAGATWDEWAEATRKVAKATRTRMPMEMDRSGHRFASLAISYGARLLDDNGNPVVDEGLKTAIRKFVGWHRDGTMPMDLWGAIGGATHRDNFSDFMNGKVVFYFGGSWSLYLMAGEAGERFEWKVVDAPCGTSSCTLMPGGGGMAAFKHTKHPQLAAKFISFLAREENIRQAIALHPNIPVTPSIVATGVEIPGLSESVRAAFDTFVRQVPAVPRTAYAFQGWRYQRAARNAITTRISQVLTNELDVETAAAFIKKDVELAIQAARK